MQTQIQQPKPPTITNIDPHKVDKYLPKLYNGELYKLEAWLPNILSTGGINSREKYDYRIGNYKAKDKPGYNSRIAVILQKIEHGKQTKLNFERQSAADRLDLILAFSQLKAAVDLFHEKNNKQLYF